MRQALVICALLILEGCAHQAAATADGIPRTAQGEPAWDRITATK